MTTKQTHTQQDIGAAMMVWYADAIRQYPEGLVTQSQASTMLNVSRMSVSRLVARGYLKAVYFPQPPEVEGFAVGKDDSFLFKLFMGIGVPLGEGSMKDFPDACYVSFGDVRKLWQDNDLQKKCKVDWVKAFKEALKPDAKKGGNR